MEIQRTITVPELAKLWLMHPKTLRKYHGLTIHPDGRTSKRTYWYYHSTIESMQLAGLNNKSAALPSLASLLNYAAATGKPPILNREQVALKLKVSTDAVGMLTRSGQLVGFRITGPRIWLYTAHNVADYIAKTSGTISLAQAAETLGLTRLATRLLVQGAPPQIERASKPGKGIKFLISAKSLLAFIERQLARDEHGNLFLTAEEWCRMRALYDYEELLTIDEASRRSHVQKPRIVDAIRQGSLPCLYTVGGHARIPLHAVNKWNSKVTPQTLMNTLSLTSEEASNLIAHPTFCRRLHDPTEKSACPTRLCLVGYIDRNRRGSVKNETWIDACNQDSMKTVRQQIDEEIAFALENSELNGVILPNGREVAVMEAELWKFRRSLRRKEGVVDYHRHLFN